VHALTDLGRSIVFILGQITELSDQPPEHDECSTALRVSTWG
jgi:hypothetical protein